MLRNNQHPNRHTRQPDARWAGAAFWQAGAAALAGIASRAPAAPVGAEGQDDAGLAHQYRGALARPAAA